MEQFFSMLIAAGLIFVFYMVFVKKKDLSFYVITVHMIMIGLAIIGLGLMLQPAQSIKEDIRYMGPKIKPVLPGT